VKRDRQNHSSFKNVKSRPGAGSGEAIRLPRPTGVVSFVFVMSDSPNRELDHFPQLSGRMNRGNYWASGLGSILGLFFFGGLTERLRLGNWVFLFFALTFGYTLFWGAFRRAHDLGWWGITGVIPPMPVLLLFLPGEEGENAYGPPPSDDAIPTEIPIDQPIPTDVNEVNRPKN
jgi:uncharacterized membrane protein YhaH (DUF805 family)